jgi:hypothetical protein
MLRRIVRSLKTVRGVIFTLLGVLLLVMWLGPSLITMGAARGHIDPQAVRTVIPLALFALCLVSAISYEKAKGSHVTGAGLHFSGAEIDFLFSGPFSRRELLLYKLCPSAVGALLTALVFSVIASPYATLWIAAFLGIWLTLLFVQLFSTAVTLISQTVAEHAYTRIRRLVLTLILVLVAVGLGRAVLGLREGGLLEALERFHCSRVGMVLLAPFDVFSRTITARTLAPELVGWGALALAIDLGLLALILRLDVNYLESAIAVSRKRYQRIEQMRRRGMVWAGRATARTRLPQMPWLGGAGPIIRRQLIQAVRGAPVLLVLLVVAALPICMMALAGRDGPGQSPLAVMPPILVFVTIMLTGMLPFDFRGDLDQMDYLKSLPLRPAALAAGQLVVPTVIMTLFHWLILGAAAALLAGGSLVVLAVTAIYAAPFNFALFSLDNLLFLLFPARLRPTTPGDLQHVGRAMVEMMVKMFLLAACCALSAACGGIAYLVSAGSWVAAVGVSWLALAILAGMLVPCVAAAFRKFDVSLDTPP